MPCLQSLAKKEKNTKKVMSDSPGIVDFAFGLVNFVQLLGGGGGGRGLNSSGSFIFGSFPTNSLGKPQAPSCPLVIALV